MRHIFLGVILGFLTPFQGLLAQDNMRQVTNHLSTSSLIRTISDNQWLVADNSNHQVFFSLVDEAAPSAQQLQLGYINGNDSMRVNDFEIYNFSNHLLNIYKTNFTYPGNCAKAAEERCYQFPPDGVWYPSFEPPLDASIIEMIDMETYTMSKPVKIICQ